MQNVIFHVYFLTLKTIKRTELLISSLDINADFLQSSDDYAKDGGPGEVLLSCSFHHNPL